MKQLAGGTIYSTMHRIVLDTNVIVSALLSRRGASYKLLALVGVGQFNICLSVPLVLEYEDAVKRLAGTKILLSEQEIDNVIDYLCAVAEHHKAYFLWRPMLRDPKDDMVLELALTAGCSFIITHNTTDFRGAEQFEVGVITPRMFLKELGALS